MVDRYDAATALIVVDVQNDFSQIDGSLYVPGAEDALPVLNREIEHARHGGALVVYSQDWHPASTPHFQKDGGIWPVHCVENTIGAALDSRLVVCGPVVRKGSEGEDGYSGFSMHDLSSGSRTPTGLEELLRLHGVRRVVVAGLATDYCVKATVLDAAALGFEVVVVQEGMRAVNLQPGDGDRAIAEMEAAGALLA